MRITTATVVEATMLFEFAAEQEIASFDGIQDLIYHSDAARDHSRWFRRPHFTVLRSELDLLDWLPEVKLMVRNFMTIYGNEVLVVLTDK